MTLREAILGTLILAALCGAFALGKATAALPTNCYELVAEG